MCVVCVCTYVRVCVCVTVAHYTQQQHGTSERQLATASSPDGTRSVKEMFKEGFPSQLNLVP